MTLVPGDPLAHRALESLLRAEASVRRRLSADLEREGLSATGFSVLVILTTAGGELELRVLRARLRTSKANATEVVTTLEGRGLVDRRRLLSDRRAASVAITPRGARSSTGCSPSTASASRRRSPCSTRPRSARWRRSAASSRPDPRGRRREGRASYTCVVRWPRARRPAAVLPRARAAGARALARARRLPRVAAPPRGRASRGSSGRARRRRTARPACTTSSAARSRTSSRAIARCAATYVERRGGWDCHGLPVEIAVEKQLGITVQGADRGVRHRRVQRSAAASRCSRSSRTGTR